MDEDESKFTWLIVLFATIGLALVVTSSLVFNRIDPSRAGTVAIGDNCNILTCPQGQPGPPSIGVPGPPGQRGEKGDRGETGPQGVPGAAGGIGPPGMCLANPACGVGPSGATGPIGPQGLQGAPGFQGAQGNPGQQGPRGETGPIGPSGPIGATGPIGPQGIPGVCDCFNQTVVYNTLNVTSNFHLGDNSTFTCGVGSFIDTNCLTAGNCPNFGMCDLQAKSLTVSGYPSSNLQVGGPSQTNGNVIFGDSIIPNFHVNLFHAYAADLVLEGNAMGLGRTILRAKNMGNVLIQSEGVGGAVMLSSGGTISAIASTNIQLISTVGQMLLQNLDNGSPLVIQSQGSVNIISTTTNSNIFIKNDNIIIQKSGSSFWMQTQFTSFDYAVSVNNSINAPSIVMFENLQINSNAAIVSTYEFLKIGPNLDVGAGRIASIINKKVKLTNGTFDTFEEISMEAPIVNLSPLPNITDYPPVNLTSLSDAGLSSGYVWFNDTNGVRISSNVYIEGSVTIGGSITTQGPKWGTAVLTVNTGSLTNVVIPLTGFQGTIPTASNCFQIDTAGMYSFSFKITGAYTNIATPADGAFVRKTAGTVTLVSSICSPNAGTGTTTCDAFATGIAPLIVGDEICLFSGSVARVWEGNTYNYFNLVKIS